MRRLSLFLVSFLIAPAASAEILFDGTGHSPVVLEGQYRPASETIVLETGTLLRVTAEGWDAEHPGGIATRLILTGPPVERTQIVNGRPGVVLVPFRRVSARDRISYHPGAARIEATIPVAGIFEASLEKVEPGEIDFHLRIERLVPPTLWPDSPVIGALQEGDDQEGNYTLGRFDRYAFAGIPGRAALLELGPAEAVGFHSLRVIEPGGEVTTARARFLETPQPVRLVLPVDSDGLYWVEVRHTNTVETPYRLTLRYLPETVP